MYLCGIVVSVVTGGTLCTATSHVDLDIRICYIPGETSSHGQSGAHNDSGGPIRATAPMWRCSRIMHMQRDLHPTILSSLEGIVDQVMCITQNIGPQKFIKSPLARSAHKFCP